MNTLFQKYFLLFFVALCASTGLFGRDLIISNLTDLPRVVNWKAYTHSFPDPSEYSSQGPNVVVTVAANSVLRLPLPLFPRPGSWDWVNEFGVTPGDGYGGPTQYPYIGDGWSPLQDVDLYIMIGQTDVRLVWVSDRVYSPTGGAASTPTDSVNWHHQYAWWFFGGLGLGIVLYLIRLTRMAYQEAF